MISHKVKGKVRLLMVGSCPKCGKRFRRTSPQDAACCLHNPDAVLVPLHPVLILPNQLYHKLEKIAGLANIRLEDLVSQLIMEAANERLRQMETSKLVNFAIPE